MLEGMLRAVPVLGEFAPSFGFCVLRHCIAARPVYLAKVIEPWNEFVPLLRRFDDYILEAIVNHDAFKGIAAANLRCPNACSRSSSFWNISQRSTRPPSSAVSPDAVISQPWWRNLSDSLEGQTRWAPPLHDDHASIMDRITSPWEAEQFLERILVELPPEKGGLGVRRISGIGGHKACVIARLRALDFMYYRGLRDFYAEVLTHRKRVGLFKIPISHAALLEDPSTVPAECTLESVAPGFLSASDPDDPDCLLNHAHANGNFQAIHQLATLCMKEQPQLVADIIGSLQLRPDAHLPTWWKHMCNLPERGHWLHLSNLMAPHQQMNSNEWCCALELQLLRTPRPLLNLIEKHYPHNAPVLDRTYRFPSAAHCGDDPRFTNNTAYLQLRNMDCHLCAARVDFIANPYHCLGCKGFQEGLYHSRHDAVLKTLKHGLSEITNTMRDNVILVDPEPVFYDLLPAPVQTDPSVSVVPPITTHVDAVPPLPPGNNNNSDDDVSPPGTSDAISTVPSPQEAQLLPTGVSHSPNPLTVVTTSNSSSNPVDPAQPLPALRPDVPPRSSAKPSDRQRADLLIKRTYPVSRGLAQGEAPPVDDLLTIVVDVGICSPLANSYLPDQSAHTLRASQTVERIKKCKYRKAIRHLQGTALFYPMIFNSSGVPGDEFFTVTADLLDLPARAIYSIAGKIGTILAIFNGRMINRYVKGLIKHVAAKASRVPPPEIDFLSAAAMDGPVLNPEALHG